MNAPYGENQCQNKVEPHMKLETDPHWEGQWFTQHKKHPHMELKVQALHEETHCVQNKKAQIQTAFVNGEKRTSQGRLISMLFGNALNRRLSTPPSRCRRRSRLRAAMEYNNPDVQFILDTLVGSLVPSGADWNLLLQDQSFDSHRKGMPS